VRLDQLTRDAIKSMFVELAEQDLSRNTLNNVLIVLRSILNGAIEDGIISTNAAGKLGRFIPRDEDNFEVVPLTQTELEALLGAALLLCPDLYPLFLALARTGMRLAEVLALRWGDVQFSEDENDKNRFIYIRRSWVEGSWQAEKRQGTPSRPLAATPLSACGAQGQPYARSLPGRQKLHSG
jgi:integrase